MMLSTDDFAAFFEEVHGYGPFPWQDRLLRRIAEEDEWPSVLDLPTGSGKTAAIDVAVFHLAMEAERGEARRAPVRIAFVVDRRLVVDDAFIRAQKLVGVLDAAPGGTVTGLVADRLRRLADDGPPLIARRLRGGIPHEGDWARTPSQPTVLCSTVDQVGSRLLFRGYGVSDSMKPVHAGLIGSDCLILLDEAHLAEPFRQTLEWVRIYKGKNWREAEGTAPWGVTLLTATPGEESQDTFSLNHEDKSHPILKKRLDASKPTRLIDSVKFKAKAEDAVVATDEADSGDKEFIHRVTAIVAEVRRALAHFKTAESSGSDPAIGVVVNRVARARAVFKQLTEKIGTEEAECLLLIGPARPVDRDNVAGQLAPIRTGVECTLEKPLILVATQCIEAGVDIDLDGLITEIAPLDALRQRFGRLNRAGRDITPYAAILASKSDFLARVDDPVYGNAIKPAWDCLMEAADKDGNGPIVEFGLNAFTVRMETDTLSPKPDAPVLLPAHLDLLNQTSPVPTADPEVGLYLHGVSRQPDAITVVWRADIDPEKHWDEEDIRRLLALVPPRSPEAIELPLWAVRRWLRNTRESLDGIADVPTVVPEEERGRLHPSSERRKIFRWKGDNERSCWITPSELRPGDTIVVPASYGGVDEFGWNPDPEYKDPATDVARKASQPFAGRRFSVRVAPGMLGEAVSDEALADALASAASQRWQDLRATLFDLDLPEAVREDLEALDDAKAGKVVLYTDLYGSDDESRPRGVAFVAPLGIKDKREDQDGQSSATEDDTSGSIPGFLLTLAEHNQDVETKAEAFARTAGLPSSLVADLKLAGYLHDVGKADPRFQAWLHYGDPLGPDPDEPGEVLAKSGRPLPPMAHAMSKLPTRWRHEAFSVRLAPCVARFAEAHDPELVLWLIGSHHGHGRPFFPHCDPDDAKMRSFPSALGLPSKLPPGPGPQSLAFDWHGLDWPMLFARLKVRYGVWELARMEAILRLSDHRASEERAKESGT